MPSTSLTSRLTSATVASFSATMILLVMPLTVALAAPEEPKPPSPLAKLHARVESAFVQCDATLLKPILSRKIKTLVATRALAPTDGYFGADQLLLLFERLFEGRTTTTFRALALDPKLRRDGRASLPIRWISSGSDQSRSELSLTLIVARDGTDWQIREIRDLK